MKLGGAQTIDGLITRYRKQIQEAVEARTEPREAILRAIGLELYRVLVAPSSPSLPGEQS